MKRYMALLCMICWVLLPPSVYADTEPVLIGAVQTESAASADEEYILLVNNSAAQVNVTGWHVQYFSATTADFGSPSRNVALGGIIAAHGTLLLAAGSPT